MEDDDYDQESAKARRAQEIARRDSEHFNKFGPDAACSVCGKDRFMAISDGPETGFGLFGSELFGQRFMPLVAVKCLNCEQVILFSGNRFLEDLPPLEEFENRSQD